MKNRFLNASLGGACTLGVAAVVLAPSMGLDPARAATGAAFLADSALVQLTNSQVTPLGLNAYAGRYGTAQSTYVGQDDPGDFTDPDGMLSRISVATANSRTSAQSSKYYAQSHLTGLVVHLNPTTDLVRLAPAGGGSVSSFDSYAECVPPPVGPWALAYNQTAGSVITVLGKQVSVGTNTLTVTGADMGVSTLGTSTLTVVVAPHTDPAAQTRQLTSEAWLDIRVSGTLNDTSGQQVYQGPISHLRLGEVHAKCGESGPTPTPTPTGSNSPNGSDSPTPSPTESPSESPSESPTGTPTPSPSPSGSPSHSGSPSPSPSPSRSGSGSSSPTPGPTTTPGPDESTPAAGGGDLAHTGSDGLTPLLAALGLALAAGGAGVLRLGRRARHR